MKRTTLDAHVATMTELVRAAELLAEAPIEPDAANAPWIERAAISRVELQRRAERTAELISEATVDGVPHVEVLAPAWPPGQHAARVRRLVEAAHLRTRAISAETPPKRRGPDARLRRRKEGA